MAWNYNLTLTPVSSTQVDLAWSAISGVTSYDIERNGSLIAVGLTGTSYSDTGVSEGVAYGYRVRGIDGPASVLSFNPETDIAWHSLFWAEGTDFTALSYANAAPVGTWPNETGESNATEATNRPVYLADGGSAYNNKPVVDFSSGVANQLVTGAFTSAPGATRTYVVIGNRGTNSPSWGRCRWLAW